MLTHFYDIESLDNAFTLCNFKPDKNTVDIYYLCDDDHLTNSPTLGRELLERIYQKNHNFRGTISLYDLKQEGANCHLAIAMGLSNATRTNDPTNKSDYPKTFRLVCDTDPDYDPDIHPYLLGYNSCNYDTTELTLYLYEVFPLESYDQASGKRVKTVTFKPTTAKIMRGFNDELFLPDFKSNMPKRLTQSYNQKTCSWGRPNYQDSRWKIRKNMLWSGRHLDVARLNEKQVMVGLKRLLGMLGHQILESDKLSAGMNRLDTADQFMDLIAYNVSDCVNLKELFNDRLYQGQFTLKKALLANYPELIYEKCSDGYKPDIRPSKVSKDRLFIDSSSAQLATKSLCPYGHLKDIPTVSFMYPSEEKAIALNIPRVNVLEESKKFFYKNFDQPEVLQKFDTIYNYYKSLEGKNFNESENYATDYRGTDDYSKPYNLANIPKVDMCMFYYLKNGNTSTCFVTFSTGGIHGAECNKTLYEHDLEKFNHELELLNRVMTIYPDPLDLKKAKNIMIDDKKYLASKFLKPTSTLKASFYKDLANKSPLLFKTKSDGSTKLNPKYVWTSADPANHEDFTSYYPNMLRMMDAFFNDGLGYDRYAEIFDNKQLYGMFMKNIALSEDDLKYYKQTVRDEPFSEVECDHYAILREGTKLVLNAASGAGDATFESNIRMNNNIISMRIIGQLFSWRIGQAQTLHDARITSTNTDGLYSVLAPEINNPILEKESESIGVEIEPEPMFLISKDSNNRIEMDAETGKIISASGGTLACHKGPNPTKALSHPALLDWALAEYLIFTALENNRGLTLSSEFNDEVGMNIMIKARNTLKPLEFLKMTQNVIASSPSSNTYVFASNDDDPNEPIILQHYNRAFIMHDETPGTQHLRAAHAKKITPATAAKRKRNGERSQQHNLLATTVLNRNGVHASSLPSDKEASIKKITNVDESWFMLIQNRALSDLSNNEVTYMIKNIDLSKYLTLLHAGFEKNWRNVLPGDTTAIDRTVDNTVDNTDEDDAA